MTHAYKSMSYLSNRYSVPYMRVEAMCAGIFSFRLWPAYGDENMIKGLVKTLIYSCIGRNWDCRGNQRLTTTTVTTSNAAAACERRTSQAISRIYSRTSLIQQHTTILWKWNEQYGEGAKFIKLWQRQLQQGSRTAAGTLPCNRM